MEIKYTKRYIIYTYILFWVMVTALAGIYVATGQKKWVLEWGSAICSWTPTFILLVMFKKLNPDTSIKTFYKNSFKQKISIPLMIIVTVLLVSIILLSSGIVAYRHQSSFLSLWDLSSATLLSGLLYTLIQGATGEESGWRGFLQPVMNKRFGVIKGSLLVGGVWSFWHTPLWFATGLGGLDLLIYIVTFIIGNLSLSVIIGTCYNYNKNLLVPIWIHFVSNFIARPYIGEPIETRCWLVLFYALAAIGFALWHKGRQSRIEKSDLVTLESLKEA